MRVGGEQPIEVDVRVIAATNRVPEEAVQDGKLREDLWYRLKVFPIAAAAAARARRRHRELLAEHFLGRAQPARKAPTGALRAGALERCGVHRWPGNVRELKNVMHRAFILAEKEIRPAHLPPELSEHAPVAGETSPLTTLAESDRRLILATLEHFDGDRQQAAEALGVSLRTLYNRLRQYRTT